MKIKPIILALVMLPINFTGGHAYAKAVHGKSAIERGHELARTHCARCHGIGPNDISSHEEAPPFEHIVERYPVENLEEAFAEGIVVGHKDMPAFEFQPAEINALLAYLGSLKPTVRKSQ